MRKLFICASAIIVTVMSLSFSVPSQSEDDQQSSAGIECQMTDVNNDYQLTADQQADIYEQVMLECVIDESGN